MAKSATQLDVRLDGKPGCGGVDLGLVADDHAASFQATNPVGDGGRGEMYPSGQLVVGQPGVGLQFVEELPVEAIEVICRS